MDAAIINGADLAAGAVAGLKHVRNPIDMARLVMEKSPHVLLVGEGAESFGRQHGIRMVDADYFHTEFRRQQLLEVQQRDDVQGCGDGTGKVKGFDVAAYGTVGAVALDKQGNLAAATSTGGMTNKRFGRVGDVPIIGAGTYADNRTAAISATGHGEYFMRTVAAHSITSRMAYRQESLAAAADAVIMGTLKEMGGGGGVIAVDARGNIVMTFNTSGMYRGAIGIDGKLMTAVYRD
jgi:beta-aspartyl-peptidase (threonine type)